MLLDLRCNSKPLSVYSWIVHQRMDEKDLNLTWPCFSREYSALFSFNTIISLRSRSKVVVHQRTHFFLKLSEWTNEPVCHNTCVCLVCRFAWFNGLIFLFPLILTWTFESSFLLVLLLLLPLHFKCAFEKGVIRKRLLCEWNSTLSSHSSVFHSRFCVLLSITRRVETHVQTCFRILFSCLSVDSFSFFYSFCRISCSFSPENPLSFCFMLSFFSCAFQFFFWMTSFSLVFYLLLLTVFPFHLTFFYLIVS